MNTPLTYAQSGVNIDAGNALVEKIKPLAKSTDRKGTMGGIGGFGALFDLKAAGFKDPVLISATDGVGTKLKIAQEAKHHSTIGIDLVAMCVNDLIVQGAEPLFFLDYLATGHLSVDVAAEVVAGIAEGCRQAGCALVGGETAEMPGMYSGEDYDLAGFAVGAAEREALLPKNVAEGDVVLGLESSGVHSNGYSLVRKIIERSGVGFHAPAPFHPTVTMAEAFLEPTRIYVKSVLAAIRETGGVKALAHITGGGLLENIPRVLPSSLAVELNVPALPPIFAWLQKEGGIDPREMWRTFNCGIGMVLVVDAVKAAEISATLSREGEDVVRLGKVIRRNQEAVVIA